MRHHASSYDNSDPVLAARTRAAMVTSPASRAYVTTLSHATQALTQADATDKVLHGRRTLAPKCWHVQTAPPPGLDYLPFPDCDLTRARGYWG